MKSLPVIGVPSDQAASGLILYSIVCGSSLVCSALVEQVLVHHDLEVRRDVERLRVDEDRHVVQRGEVVVRRVHVPARGLLVRGVGDRASFGNVGDGVGRSGRTAAFVTGVVVVSTGRCEQREGEDDDKELAALAQGTHGADLQVGDVRGCRRTGGWRRGPEGRVTLGLTSMFPSGPVPEPRRPTSLPDRNRGSNGRGP